MQFSKASFFCYLIATLLGVIFVVAWTVITQGEFGFSRFSFELFFLAVVLYPLCEEIIFRGTVQSELQKRITFTSKSIAFISLSNFITSALFALTHALYFQQISAAVVFFPSLVFGYLYEKEKNLIAPILMHSVYNFLGLLGTPSF